MEFVIYGLTNGIVFAPPSEWAIWLALKNGGNLSDLHTFILSNILGHAILFLLVRRWPQLVDSVVLRLDRLINKRGLLHRFYEDSIIWLAEPTGSYLFYGRLLPFFHTSTSIIAAKTNERFLKFLLLTILGDYSFAGLIGLHFAVLSKFFNQYVYLIILFATGALIHFIVRRLRK